MKILKITVILTALMLSLAGCVPSGELPAAAPDAPAELLTVNATATAEAVPDRIIINIGAQATGETAKQAKDNGSASLNAMIDTLLGLGVEQDDIRTSQMSIAPRYRYNDNGERTLLAYNYSCMLTISVLDAELANSVIDDGIAAGGNALDGLSYEISDETAIYEQTLEQAIAAARSKAELMAKASGKKLGGVKEIVERNDSFGYEYLDKSASAAAGDTSSRVMAGTQSVTASATVTFYLEDAE